MTTIKEATLPNGLEVFYASEANLEILRREIFEDNLYQKHGIDFRDGDCIVDVGANIGCFGLYLNQVLRNGSLHAFEPVPETYQLLQRNMERHNHLDAHLHNCGLSDTPGQATLTHFPRMNVASTFFPDDSPEFRASSRNFVLEEIRERHPTLRFLVNITPSALWWPLTEMIRRHYQKGTEVDCQLRTLSDVIDEHQIDQIDFLKVDTEGAERQVLDGIRDEHWPRIRQAVVEVHHGFAAREEIVELLKRQGFETHAEQPLANTEHLQMVYAIRHKSLP